MKILINKTATAEDHDGTEYVFGPEGREYSIGEGGLTKEMASDLVKRKAASKINVNTVKPMEVTTDGD